MKLIDATRDIAAGRERFQAQPYYVPSADSLFYYGEDAETYRDRIDGVLTVCRAFDDRRIVGFQIKGISALVEKCEAYRWWFKDSQISLSLLIAAADMFGEPDHHSEERRSLYLELMDFSKDKSVDRSELQEA